MERCTAIRDGATMCAGTAVVSDLPFAAVVPPERGVAVGLRAKISRPPRHPGPHSGP